MSPGAGTAVVECAGHVVGASSPSGLEEWWSSTTDCTSGIVSTKPRMAGRTTSSAAPWLPLFKETRTTWPIAVTDRAYDP
jgi:hypothetical protein